MSAPFVGALPPPSIFQGDDCGLVELTGCRRWSTVSGALDPGFGVTGLISSEDSRTLFVAGSRVGAMDAATGATIWSVAGPTYDMDVAGGGVFVSAFRSSGIEVGRWNATSGSSSWSTQLPPIPDAVPNGPKLSSSSRLLAVDGDGTRVYVVGYQNSLKNYVVIAALDGTTGSLVWRKNLPGYGAASDLALSKDEGTLYLRSFFSSPTSTSHLQAIDTATGNFRWLVSHPSGTLGYQARLFFSANGTEMHVAGGVRPAPLTLFATQVATFNATTGALVRSGIYSDDPLLALAEDADLVPAQRQYASVFGSSPDGTRIYSTGFDSPLSVCPCDATFNVGTMAIDVVNQTTLWYSRWAPLRDDAFGWGGYAIDVAQDGTIAVEAGTSPSSSGERIAALIIDPATGLTISSTITEPGSGTWPTYVAFAPDSRTAFFGARGRPTSPQAPGGVLAVAARTDVAADLPLG